jgi:hypothetical protein
MACLSPGDNKPALCRSQLQLDRTPGGMCVALAGAGTVTFKGAVTCPLGLSAVNEPPARLEVSAQSEGSSSFALCSSTSSSQESLIYHRVATAVTNSAPPPHTRVIAVVLSKTSHANEARKNIVAHIRLELYNSRLSGGKADC